jgi:hypothetical protein
VNAETAAIEDDQVIDVLRLDERDRWFVFGKETQSPGMVLAVMLQCVSDQPVGEA